MSAEFDFLAEASYRGIVFPVESADVDGGNDFAEHVAYRRRGSDMEPAGVKAYAGTLTIPLLNTAPLVQRYGTLWPDKRADLVEAFSDHPIGTLIHPTWGSLEVAILSWSASDSPDVRNGQRLKVQWKEHNATLASLTTLDGVVSTDPSTTLTAKTATADALAAGKAGYVPITPGFTTQMTLLESGVSLSYSQVTGAFAVMFGLVNAALALQSLAAVSGHAAIIALLNVRAATQSYYARFAPGVAGVRYVVVPSTMSVADIALLAYGDISRTQSLYAANSFPDPLLVPAGTVVTVLP